MTGAPGGAMLPLLARARQDLVRRLAPLAIAPALCLALAGCGGGDGGDGAAHGFVADANAACTAGQRHVVDLYLAGGLPASPQQQLEFDQAVVPVRVALLGQLRKLVPPADGRQAFRRYVGLRQAVISLSRDLVIADGTGSPAAARIRGKIDQTQRRSNAAAARLGLDVCALKLSPADSRAATAVVKEVETTRDPQRACRDLVTPQLIASRFPGGYDQCAAFVKQHASDFPTSIKVTHVQGTNGVLANVDFEEVHGQHPGSWASATVFFIDGRWKVFAAQAKSSGG